MLEVHSPLEVLASNPEIPVFSKDDIELQGRLPWRLLGLHRSKWNSGAEKRVVDILFLSEGKRIASVLKLARPYVQGYSSYQIPRLERVKDARNNALSRDIEQRAALAEKEYQDLLLLYDKAPKHFPKPLGLYVHGRHRGIIVEKVFGKKLSNPFSPYASHEQSLSLREGIAKLHAQGIEVNLDYRYPYNLLWGHTTSDPEKRLVCIDASINENASAISVDWRVLQAQLAAELDSSEI